MAKRFVAVTLFLLVIFGGIFGFKYLQMQGMAAEMAKPQPPAVVSTTEVRQETWRPSLRAVGSLTAVRGIDVASEVAGKVSRVTFESGAVVDVGTPLIELDATVDRATLEGAKADRRLALVQLRRSEDLLGRQAISKSQHDEAQAKYDAADARVAEQEERIAQKSIRAPFAGVLGIRRINLGQYISPGARIVSLQALDPIYVDYALPERNFSEMRKGLPIEVRADAYADEVFKGRITAIDSGIDVGTRTIRLRASLDNPDGRLRPGMFVEVLTFNKESREVLTVPRTAVSFNTYGSFLYAVTEEEDGTLRAKRQQVTTGKVREGRVVVTEGLQAGQQVVRAGLVKLRDGQAITADNSVELDDAEVTTE
ncbi:efflux RND transporter periplasmic adaptor subunit [Thiohalomonas denitrificans]|uniref:Membrane fusion protein, multidrug efflux system n=1 Tax=Thiohalomonas denitrificans TaxID=415747 RepID=A0A1G5R2Q3_9GAMM|nr:efflux RND transporter periplasmic adaptor subunit [Thiohalomonas denitrificans]SCZ67731.1 membrane fusion protein, multidrug efflux system [Thiohalomonas denitrificans]